MVIRYDVLFFLNVAGRKCNTHRSKKASAVFHWSHKYTIHVWGTCSYCVSYLPYFFIISNHILHFSLCIYIASLSSFCRLSQFSRNQNSKNHSKEEQNTILDNKIYYKVYQCYLHLLTSFQATCHHTLMVNKRQ